MLPVAATMIHFSPKSFQSKLPAFCCRPFFVVGIPVALAIFCLIFVTPNARFQDGLENPNFPMIHSADAMVLTDVPGGNLNSPVVPMQEWRWGSCVRGGKGA